MPSHRDELDSVELNPMHTSHKEDDHAHGTVSAKGGHHASGGHHDVEVSFCLIC